MLSSSQLIFQRGLTKRAQKSRLYNRLIEYQQKHAGSWGVLHSMRVWKVRTDALDYTGDRLLETYLYGSRELKEYMLEYRVACSSGSRLPNLAFEAMNLLPQGLLMISHVFICISRISIHMIHGWMLDIKGSRLEGYRWMSCEAAIGTTQGPTILAVGSMGRKMALIHAPWTPLLLICSGFMRTIQPFCTVQLGLASGQRVPDGDAFVFVLQGADMSCMCRLQWYHK